MQRVDTIMTINGQRIMVEGKALRIASFEQEWYEDVEDPQTLINELRKSESRPDILTFWQRLPDTQPKYSYSMEVEPIAAPWKPWTAAVASGETTDGSSPYPS